MSDEEEVMRRFKALPQREQDKILDKYRYILVEDDEWWTDLVAELVSDIEEHGYAIKTRSNYRGDKLVTKPCVYFSGFGTQGDYAYFEGRVNDWPRFVENYPLIKNAIDKGSEPLLCWSNFSYRQNLGFDDIPDFPSMEDLGMNDTPLRKRAYDQLIADMEVEWLALVADVKDKVKAWCEHCLTTLRNEYEWLTSDECLLDHLWINGHLEEEVMENEDETTV